MKTLKFFRVLLIAVAFICAAPVLSVAADGSAPIAHRQEQINRLQNRLEEIREMDVKKLSREDKKALRKEVRTIKKEMKALSGGVYISVGAILLIALLLILLA